jgi:hypothetical protein
MIIDMDAQWSPTDPEAVAESPIPASSNRRRSTRAVAAMIDDQGEAGPDVGGQQMLAHLPRKLVVALEEAS